MFQHSMFHCYLLCGDSTCHILRFNILLWLVIFARTAENSVGISQQSCFSIFIYLFKMIFLHYYITVTDFVYSIGDSLVENRYSLRFYFL